MKQKFNDWYDNLNEPWRFLGCLFIVGVLPILASLEMPIVFTAYAVFLVWLRCV